MTSRDFCYWLQGYFEIHEKTPRPPEPHDIDGLNADQVACVKRHLAMVFIHEIDPSMGGPKEQTKLSEAHSQQSSIPNGGPAPGVLYRC